jgi:hypothetical protein
MSIEYNDLDKQTQKRMDEVLLLMRYKELRNMIRYSDTKAFKMAFRDLILAGVERKYRDRDLVNRIMNLMESDYAYPSNFEIACTLYYRKELSPEKMLEVFPTRLFYNVDEINQYITKFNENPKLKPFISSTVLNDLFRFERIIDMSMTTMKETYDWINSLNDLDSIPRTF